MCTWPRLLQSIALAAVLTATGSGWAAPAAFAAGLTVDPAALAVRSAASGPAQFFGGPWGGSPFGGGGFVYYAPDFNVPYAGSPGYPYYRYGSYYGSAYGLPYPVPPSYGAYYGGSVSPAWPSYSSAGGVALGDGGLAPFGRCIYSALAGVGGSWSDPQSYGYVAPFC
jgi:hypothetical protein